MAPVPGVLVNLINTDTNNPFLPSVTTDDNGNFTATLGPQSMPVSFHAQAQVPAQGNFSAGNSPIIFDVIDPATQTITVTLTINPNPGTVGQPQTISGTVTTP